MKTPSAQNAGALWRVAADTGGTFTDCIGIDPRGRVHCAKVLSSGGLRARVAAVNGEGWVTVEAGWAMPDGFFAGARASGDDGGAWAVTDSRAHPAAVRLAADGEGEEECPWPGTGSLLLIDSGEEAPVLGFRLLSGTPLREPLPPADFRLGTTKGTNALLEGKGEPVALFVTEGFGDLLEIGDQTRPELFSLIIERARLHPKAIFEVRGRASPCGEIIEAPDRDALRHLGEAARAQGIRMAVVALLHSYAAPEIEEAVAGVLRSLGIEKVVTSAGVSPRIKFLDRLETAVVEGTLAPILDRYLDAVARALGETGRLGVMNSAGGLLPRERFQAVDSLLSGPAGGVAGAAVCARQVGWERMITFDMGGTSTDVARWEGRFSLRNRRQVGPARIVAPSLRIETVAAGGGSLCGFADGRLIVGPGSAGADPGPAAYGRGGPLTLTDVHLLLGRLDPEAFQIPVNRRAAEQAFAEIEGVGGMAEGEILQGFLQIANERMAQAVRQISVREGYDVRDYGLVVYGGAGGLHACGVAALLGIARILVPANAGLLSALGMLHAARESRQTRQILAPWDDFAGSVGTTFADLEATAREALRRDGVEEAVPLDTLRTLEMRAAGQEHALAIEETDDWTGAFAQAYEQAFGFYPPELQIEVVAASVTVSTRPSAPEAESVPSARGRPEPLRTLKGKGGARTPVFERHACAPGDVIRGPALIVDLFSATFVEAGWTARLGSAHSLVLTAEVRRGDGGPDGNEAGGGAEAETDPLRTELFRNRFASVVSEMGDQLQRTALSVNIRERLDFSCALLDAEGRLVVNAPHIPVHLGALGACVRSLMQTFRPAPGDVWLTNHPAHGGSHLPDVTVVAPVFADGGCVAFLANRAHHAEIGGRSPGSMPPDARCLADEGVVLSPMRVVREGQVDLETVDRCLREAAWPSRNPRHNRIDLQAQLAALRLGARQLGTLLNEYGSAVVTRYFDVLRAGAQNRLRDKLNTLPVQHGCARETLDDGTPLCVAWEWDGEALRIDFTGTGGVHPGNLNATPAIVSSAVLYTLQCLAGDGGLLNEGLLDPVDLRIPPNSLLQPDFSGDPTRLPAVVGGNVETSQRLVDTLFKAFSLAACSQGTMNNFLFGSEDFGYYETIGGGSGAGEGFHGASGTQVHMTNTAITDPEILEARFPVRLRRFALRRGSGGAGAFRGGDGLVREFEFLAPLSLSLLTQHRRVPPYGVSGGRPGATGRQIRIGADGAESELPGITGFRVSAGERLRIETPGGGGWGSPPNHTAPASDENEKGGSPK
ncbi:MAG: hydantoinase B/oxoprolinase family protein [Opitutales bacterium]|nr:hydantoinase B/oxoprolinase family protein [Opitutales bacterium]